MWWHAALVSLGVLVAVWLVFLAYLALAHPDTGTLADMPRVLPDTVRMVRRLAADRDVPLSSRVAVYALLGYLVCPIDLVPDFIPVLGYADDVIVAALVLRRVVRTAGPEKVAAAWPGSAEGLRAVYRMCGLRSAD